MANNIKSAFEAMERGLPSEISKISKEAKVMGVRFFKSSFRKQGYTDKVFIPWRRRKDGKS